MYSLFKAETIHKRQNFVWLAFLEKETENFQNHNLKVPYDCEFIVIQSENETAKKLTEIYEVKNRSFALDFGTWDRNFGLKVPNVGFYIRRYNFQKTEIQVQSFREDVVRSENGSC